MVTCVATMAGCVDATGTYEEGYQDGYDGGSPREFVLFGRDDYAAGYEDGSYDADCDYWKKRNYERYRRYCREHCRLDPNCNW